MNIYEEFEQLVCEQAPPVFLILGSGQGQLAQRVERATSLPFHEVPGLPRASVPGHKGCLTLGRLAGVTVLVSEGRVHGYEGHPPEAVVRTTQLAAQWGARLALITNAAGGIRGDLEPGSLLPVNALICWNRVVPNILSPRWVGKLGDWPGSYLMVSGPSYETPAEIVAMRRYGADAVGMSTVPEALEAARCGMEVAVLSLITNKAAGLATGVNHQEVLEISRTSAEQLGDRIESVLAAWKREKA
jgi:purine-nucleoside phosphorylase